MSVILDALKKAQEQRKKPSVSGPFQGAVNESNSRRPLYIGLVAGSIAIAALVVLLLPRFFGSAVKKTVPPSPGVAAVATVPVSLPANPKPPQAAAKVDTTKEKDGGMKAKKDDRESLAVVRRPADSAVKTVDTKAVKMPRERRADRLPADEKRDNSRFVMEKIDETRITDLYNSAVRAGVQGNLKEAKRLYHALLQEQPRYNEALNNLGVIALREGKTKEALFYFQKCLENKKDYAKAYNNIGLVMVQEGQKKIAEENFRKAIELEGETVEPYINLSGLLRGQQRQEEALKLLRVIIDRKVKSSGLFLSYALLLDESGNYSEAVRYYRYYLTEGGEKESRAKVIERVKVLEEYRPAGNP
ncbi:MAG: hypothetical protein C0392_00200 [Syntrophus sp. (in: bacteria)]|nr:hypothetical protein [Syntrophus sp. (in: bacteria)]